MVLKAEPKFIKQVHITHEFNMTNIITYQDSSTIIANLLGGTQ